MRKIFEDGRVSEIAEQIKRVYPYSSEVGLVLGSGWNGVCDDIVNKIVIPYAQLKGMPACSVEGHQGNFILGWLGGKNVVVAQGRFHLYEGKNFDDVLLPISVMYALGIETLLLTNAAGGINPSYKRGDFMVLRDHINYTFQNPLVGRSATPEFPVFCDMSEVYNSDLQNIILTACAKLNIRAHRGVYLQVIGPSYETPAEIRAFERAGADAVGMSTVAEAIFAKYLHLKTGAISLITNMGAGIEKSNLDHNDVLDQALKNKEFCSTLISLIVEAI